VGDRTLSYRIETKGNSGMTGKSGRGTRARRCAGVIICAQLLFTGTLRAVPPQAGGQGSPRAQQDPKALEVLKEAVETLGGAGKIFGRETIYVKRKITNYEYPDPVEGTLTIYYKRPGKFRKEISYPNLNHVEVYDGARAWFDQGTGPQLRSEAITNSIRVALGELDIPANYLDAELTYFNISQEIPGKLAHVLKVRKDGYTRELMFDIETHLLEVCGEYENPWGATDKMTRYDRYRPVDGVMVPYLEEKWRSNRMVTTSEIVEIEFNGEIDDALFEFPGDKSE
jgi:hypothetical protein